MFPTSPDVARLRDRVGALRPRPGEPAGARLDAFLDVLAKDPERRDRLAHDVRALLGRVHAATWLAEAGILNEGGPTGELVERVLARVLPPLPEDDELRAALAEIFDQRGDSAWLAAIPPATWDRLGTVFGLRADPTQPLPHELALAIRVLAHRVAAQGLRPVLTSRVPTLALDDSPFLRLSDEVLAYERSHGDGLPDNEGSLLARCLATLEECRATLEALRLSKHRYGTSLELTALSFRMVGMIERLTLLLRLTAPHEASLGRLVGALLAALVEAEEERHALFGMVRRHADLLLYQVVERAASTGEAYITRTRAELRRFLWSSLSGGVIVALFAAIKVKLAGLALPLAGQALVYSLNYAVCFVLIYVTGATLATKQPAVTAHTLAATLDRADGSHDVRSLAETVVSAWRSQVVSLLGNLATAFPVALGLALVYRWVTGSALAGPSKAATLVGGVHPWEAPTLWFAAIAGVYLFSAGLVSGWVDNRLVYSRVPERLAAHPLWVSLLGRERTARLAELVDAKAGGITGNVWLGFCLGATGTIGHILGLPLDIRHIAFGSAHLAIGLDGLDWALSSTRIGVLAGGVLLIGVVNLVVSFGLALFLAVESRGLSLREDRTLLAELGARLRRHPGELLLPSQDSEGARSAGGP